ncbi:MAG: SHOCT domain-containing protein [Proteobacteria bacterium]|nr:SHOCT domain-containing protein [Pseudomonadota bacterium]MBU1687085.1 SHOCT domain-containing protein [Pseudomonadota bacterium]
MMWGNGFMNGWGPGTGIGGMFMMLLFWGLIIAGLVWLYRLFMKSDRTEFIDSRETPLDILKKRYARGEINKDDFERMKKDLES